MSLKLRISLLVSALLAGAVGGLAGVLLWNERRILVADMERSHLTQGAALAEVCRDATVNDQALPLANYLKRLKNDPEVLEALCQDTAGRVLGHTHPARTDTVLDDERARTALVVDEAALLVYERGADAVLEAAVPVSLGPKRLGTARLLFSRRAVEERFRQGLSAARRRILLASAPFLFAGFGGAFLITALVLRPFGRLVEGVRRMGEGDLARRVALSGRDEVAWLGGEVDRMAEKLGELDRMKQDFVNSVTHDLKSPLSSLKIAADVVREETESLLAGRRPAERLADAYLHIREGLERLTHLIVSLLDVARIESALALDRRPTGLEEIADRVVRAFELVARRKGLELSLALENDVPAVPLDEAKMERVFSNLVSNALKFTEKGAVRIRLADRGDAVEARVEDTGPGVPPEALDKLFSKFFRVRRPGEKTEGAGLGLAIVKGFVEAHGGRVTVESRPGAGTVFTVRLPKGA